MSAQKNAYIDANPVIVSSNCKIILAKRKKGSVGGGKWHLPGGRVQFRETFEETLKRVSLIKTNLKVGLSYSSLEQSLVGIYDNPDRDPREHVISIAFFCRILGGEIKPGANVDDVKSFSERELKNLEIAFDHRRTLEEAFLKIKDRGSAKKSISLD